MIVLCLLLLILSNLSSFSAASNNNKINERGFSFALDTDLCPQPSRCTIPSIDYTDHNDFLLNYREIRPVILRGATKEWPAVSGSGSAKQFQFTFDYLHDTWNATNLSVGGSIEVVTAAGLVEMSSHILLSEHLNDMKALRQSVDDDDDDADDNDNGNRTIRPTRYQTAPRIDGTTFDNEPKYVFHRGSWANKHLYTETSSSIKFTREEEDPVRKQLKQTCTPVDTFINQSTNVIEYILGVGAAGSGTTIHRHGESWLNMIEGTKRFIMYPPHHLPPLQYQSEISQRDWIKNVYEQNDTKVQSLRSEECVVRRGDALYIPSGWFHSTINCDDTIALALQSTITNVPLGLSEMQLEYFWRSRDRLPNRLIQSRSHRPNPNPNPSQPKKITPKLLKNLYKRLMQIVPKSPIINILWSEAHLQLKTMRNINIAYMYAKKSRDEGPNTGNTHLCVAQVLATRVSTRVKLDNYTKENYIDIMRDVSEMAQEMMSALDLDRRVMKGVGTFVAKGIFALFHLLNKQKLLPKLGEHFILDVGLDIVEERARSVLQKDLLQKLQHAVDAEACLWSKEYKWLISDSSDARPVTLEEFRQHEHATTAVQNTLGIDSTKFKKYSFSKVWKMWESLETIVQKFARELKEMGGGEMWLQSSPEYCKDNGKRHQLQVKTLMSKISGYEKGDRPVRVLEEEEL